MMIVEIMYEIACKLTPQKSTTNHTIKMKSDVEKALQGMRLGEAFQNAGVKVRAEFAWLFFDNPLSDMDPKTEELRPTQLPPSRTGTPQLIFATGIVSVKAGETNL